MCYGTTSIARCCHQHSHLAGFITQKIPQAATHKACAHIFKCQRWAMKQFQCCNMFVHVYQRYRKAECFCYDTTQLMCRNGITYIRPDHFIGNAGFIQLFQILQYGCLYCRNGFGKIKSFVRSLSLNSSFAEINNRRLPVGTEIFHLVK